MRVKILGKWWKFMYVSRIPSRTRGDPDDRGVVDSPEVTGKKIKIKSSLQGEEELEVIIHECLHAASWSMSEEFVSEFAGDMARILTRLGYHIDDTDRQRNLKMLTEARRQSD